jgi:uncharacterized phiE125 gp8 family phage protein
VRLTLITAPTEEPVTLVEAKQQLRVDHSEEDAFIDQLIAAARQEAEVATRRAFITQTWELKLAGFPCSGVPIEIPLSPLVSVTSVSYLDTAGASQTWASSDYTVDAPAGPRPPRGRIIPDYALTYPSTQMMENSVTVRFVAGYGAAVAVPQGIKQAILLRVGDLYARRESAVVGAMFTDTRAAESLLWPYRSLVATA